MAAADEPRHREGFYGETAFQPGYFTGVCAVDDEPWPCRATSPTPPTPSPSRSVEPVADRVLVRAPRDGTRLVEMSDDLAAVLGGRTLDGRLLSYEWGEPQDGVYEAIITATDDGHILVEREALERVRSLLFQFAFHEDAASRCVICGTPPGADHDSFALCDAVIRVRIIIDAALATLTLTQP